jgi:hypothetical protein
MVPVFRWQPLWTPVDKALFPYGANHPVFSGSVLAKDKASFSLSIKRDLRRAALLGWIIPFSAALSKELTATITIFCADSSSPEKISLSALIMLVLHRLRTDLLRNRPLSTTRTCFRDDLITGNIYLLSYLL